MSESFDAADVVLCPGGPMLVRGAGSIRDSDGAVHQVDRPLVALCRCRKSSLLPWCDATHKLLPEDRRPDA
ncbi:MAG: CDGSH iron-sulfur domain-containing protein [Actinomycetota bacterium]|nr:CDGSH iron-sulfur domain-containing protein [Actinomycetota bacterium]